MGTNKIEFSMEYAPVDYERVHSELKRVCVNLKLLWNEYLIDCKGIGKLPCSYDKYFLSCLRIDFIINTNKDFLVVRMVL